MPRAPEDRPAESPAAALTSAVDSYGGMLYSTPEPDTETETEEGEETAEEEGDE